MLNRALLHKFKKESAKVCSLLLGVYEGIVLPMSVEIIELMS